MEMVISRNHAGSGSDEYRGIVIRYAYVSAAVDVARCPGGDVAADQIYRDCTA